MVAMGFDGLFTIHNAVRIAGSTDSLNITAALYITEFSGALGKTKMNEHGIAEKIERIFVVRDGKPVLVE